MRRSDRKQKSNGLGVWRRGYNIELLEPRTVLSASAVFSSGALSILGDANANSISISEQTVGSTRYLLVQDNGSTIFDGTPSFQNVAVSAVQTISIDTGAGADLVALQDVTLSNGFMNISGVTISTGEGNDSIIGSGFADEILAGDDDDFLQGGGGNDTMSGGDGDDVYDFTVGDNGSDTLIELVGEGQDWLSFADSDAAITLSLSSTDPQRWGDGAITLSDASTFENVLGSAFNDFIYGNLASNYFLGGDGDDTLAGDGGSDFLVGDIGQDVLSGGADDDVLLGGSGADSISGDLGDDFLLASDFVPDGVAITSLQDIAGIGNTIMATWTATSSVADRLANMMGSTEATDPIISGLQFRPGESVINDGVDADIINSLSGSDAIFLDYSKDLSNKNDDAIYISDDPSLALFEAAIVDGILTVSSRMTEDIVYTVVDGYLKVNGHDILSSPLPIDDVVQILTKLDRLSGDLDDSALLNEDTPNLQAIAVTRARSLSLPTLEAEDIDTLLQSTASEDWQLLTSFTAQDIADEINTGNFAPYWEVISAGLLANQGASRSASWSDIADNIGSGLDSIILSESRNGGESTQSESAGAEGGTLDIQDANNVPEDEWAVFPVIFNAEYFNGCSVNWKTIDGSAIGGTQSCNSDFNAVNNNTGFLSWMDSKEGDSIIKVKTFSDYRLESNENFQVQLSNIQNLDGPEGNMTIGRSTATGVIENTTTVPKASISGGGTVTEGGHLAFKVQLDHPIQDASITVSWSAADISTEGSQDYTPASGSVTFSPITCEFEGDIKQFTEQFIDITTVNNTVPEYTETLSVTISAGANVTIADGNGTANGSITDDDPDPILSSANIAVTEGAAANFVLTLSSESEKNITLSYATIDQSAIAKWGDGTIRDYESKSLTTITFAPGVTTRTVTILTNDDSIPEPQQYFLLGLGNGSNVRFPGNLISVAYKCDINDNDPLHAKIVFVSYEGTGNIPIYRDPSGPASFEYSGPHYSDVDHDGDATDVDDHQYPIAYVKRSTPTLLASIWAEKNEFVGPFKIKGNGDWNITLAATVSEVNDAGLGDGSVIVSTTITSDGHLPDQVDYLDELNVAWEIKADDDASGWHSAGSSKNQAYLTLAAPAGGVTVWHTLIDIGSRNSQGAITEGGVIYGSWSEFEDQDVHRVDGTPLTYYKNFNILHTTTRKLLEFSDGQCAAWAHLFLDVLKVQGINRTDDYVHAQIDPAKVDAHGFIVGDWYFDGPGRVLAPANPAYKWYNVPNIDYKRDTYYYWEYAQVHDLTGIEGQGNDDPASMFDNHQFVLLDGVYYDPSYGVTYSNEQDFDNVLDGFYVETFMDVPESEVGYDLTGDSETNDFPNLRVYIFQKNPTGDDVKFTVGQD